MGNAAALYNMVRTIGGGIGIALLIAFLSRGTQTHQAYLTTHIHPYNQELVQRFMAMNSGAIPSWAGSGFPADTFLQFLYGEVQRQALLMAFLDDFRLIAIIFFLLIPLVFVMRRPQKLGGSTAAH
jgi:DHA2 family multidrug resistance protein